MYKRQHPELLILDEPTRGIDIGAKAEIQQTVLDLAADGMGVVFISSELEEVVRLSDDIEVLKDRHKIAEIENDDTVSQQTIAETIKIIDNPKIKNDLSINVGVIIAALVVVFGYILLHKTRTGRTIYAIGGSRSSAELMGLPVKRTQYIIYLTSGTLAALATDVYTANIGSAKNTVGVGWELDAVASVVIGGAIVTGGFGYVLGSVVGALVRSTIDPLTADFGVPSEWTTIVVGLMILAVVVLQRAVTAVGKKQ